MAVNKVVFGTETLIDLTGDTVTPEVLLAGYTAHNASGDPVEGDALIPDDVDAALTEKGVTVPDGARISELAALISEIEVGGGGTETAVTSKDVNFIDYDGTVLYSYTLDEAQALTALPDLPTHSGLICQGWNWSLDDIKALGRDVTVGAMYITDDGKTRLYIHLEDGRTSPVLGICPNGTVTVDWGDGTATDILTGTSTSTVQWTPNHEYASAGDYVITLTVDGSAFFYGVDSTNQYAYILRYSSSADTRNRCYQNALRKVEIGSNIIISKYAFYNCYSLSSITIPSNVTSIGARAFYNCYSLSSITIPSSVKSIGTYTFYNCFSLSSITIPSSVKSIGNNAFEQCFSLSSITIPSSVTSIGARAFYNCYNLSSITIPSNVTSIGTYAFYNCYSLSSITIPSNVTSIGARAFYNCYSLSSITIPSSVKSIGTYTFYNCFSLSSITIPSSVKSIGNNAFEQCFSLSSITIPSSVTSIGARAFYNCYNLSSITIPSNVTSIGTYAFYNCYSVKYYDFTKHTSVPTLSNTNAFDGIAADCEIRVPASLYDEWIAATNWSKYANYIVAM